MSGGAGSLDKPVSIGIPLTEKWRYLPHGNWRRWLLKCGFIDVPPFSAGPAL